MSNKYIYINTVSKSGVAQVIHNNNDTNSDMDCVSLDNLQFFYDDLLRNNINNNSADINSNNANYVPIPQISNRLEQQTVIMQSSPENKSVGTTYPTTQPNYSFNTEKLQKSVNDFPEVPLPLEKSPELETTPTGGRIRGRKPSRTDEHMKNFQCKFCTRKFKRQEHVKRHIRSLHTGERPFGCRNCGKFFSRSDNLHQHMKIHSKSI